MYTAASFPVQDDSHPCCLLELPGGSNDVKDVRGLYKLESSRLGGVITLTPQNLPHAAFHPPPCPHCPVLSPGFCASQACRIGLLSPGTKGEGPPTPTVPAPPFRLPEHLGRLRLELDPGLDGTAPAGVSSPQGPCSSSLCPLSGL